MHVDYSADRYVIGTSEKSVASFASLCTVPLGERWRIYKTSLYIHGNSIRLQSHSFTPAAILEQQFQNSGIYCSLVYPSECEANQHSSCFRVLG